MLLSRNGRRCSSKSANTHIYTNTQKENLKDAKLHYFIERAQQLVCSAALGQKIEPVDKIECQRANGHGETERGEQRSLAKWREQRRPGLNSQVSVKQNEERMVCSFQKEPCGGADTWIKGKKWNLLLTPVVEITCQQIMTAA